jgi:hypothetical protein
VTSDATETKVDVRLLRFPLHLGARASEYYQGLFREFALLAASTPEDTHAVPVRLLALIDALGRRYPTQTEHEEERRAALERGEVQADFVIAVPVSAAEASRALDGLLDEADDFCRSGELLTLAAPEDATAFRRWYLREVIAQLSGEAPTPWPGGLD